MSLRLSRRQRYTIDMALALVALSGVAWLLLDAGDAPDALERARWWLRQDVRLHAFAGLAVIYLAGMLWLVHIRRAWRSHRNRVAGVATLGTLAWLAATGYALGYFTDDATHLAVARAHWIAGLGAVALYVAHRWRGARTRPSLR